MVQPFKYRCQKCKFEWWQKPKHNSICPMCKHIVFDVLNWEEWSSNPENYPEYTMGIENIEKEK